MLVQCPNCKNLFDLPESSFAASKFRCSSCKAVWENNHRLSQKQSQEPRSAVDWILLWSALGLLAVALYIDFPRVSLFFSDLKTNLYRNNQNPFELNKAAEDEYATKSLPPIKNEVTTFNLTEDPNA